MKSVLRLCLLVVLGATAACTNPDRPDPLSQASYATGGCVSGTRVSHTGVIPLLGIIIYGSVTREVCPDSGYSPQRFTGVSADGDPYGRYSVPFRPNTCLTRGPGNIEQAC